MRVLIIGYGSIGKRHYEILGSFESIESIDVVSRQNLQNIKTFKELSDIKNLDSYDYFIISSETARHYRELKYICSKVENKKILVEKPLYDKKQTDIKTNNRIFVAYNLRFHPIIERLKEILSSKEVYYANIICGQYLPTWRPTQDYRDSYSSDINRGGGVLRDLSHELDYINLLFGDITKIDSINTKISDLEINSDDIFTAIATTTDRVIVNLTLDYISKTPIRRILIHTKDSTIEADLIANTLVIYNKMGEREEIKIEPFSRDYTYQKMHRLMVENQLEALCSFVEGERVVGIIDGVEFRLF